VEKKKAGKKKNEGEKLSSKKLLGSSIVKGNLVIFKEEDHLYGWLFT
jgi:hypothetical protein